jgi:hypothetical protein
LNSKNVFSAQLRLPFANQLRIEITAKMYTWYDWYDQSYSTVISNYEMKVEVVCSLVDVMSTLSLQQQAEIKVKEKVEFIQKMLTSKDDMWVQQASDFGALLTDLLSDAKILVSAQQMQSSTLSKMFSSLYPFSRDSSSILRQIEIKIQIPKSLVREFWFKCVKCGHMHYSALAPQTSCTRCSYKF